jgi:NhaP-type Na+/H+ or K+/H+ antiporter
MAAEGIMRREETGSRAPARHSRRLLVPVLSGLVLAALGAGFVVYALWPRWPAASARA